MTRVLRHGEAPDLVGELLSEVRQLSYFDTLAELRALYGMAQHRHVLEVGTHLGASAITMALGGARHVDCVDWHQGGQGLGPLDTLAACWANLERFHVRDQVTLHVGRSADVLPALARERFDAVLIDGDHERAREDTLLCLPLVRHDAVWAFHDAGRWAVDEGIAIAELNRPAHRREQIDSLVILW